MRTDMMLKLHGLKRLFKGSLSLPWDCQLWTLRNFKILHKWLKLKSMGTKHQTAKVRILGTTAPGTRPEESPLQMPGLPTPLQSLGLPSTAAAPQTCWKTYSRRQNVHPPHVHRHPTHDTAPNQVQLYYYIKITKSLNINFTVALCASLFFIANLSKWGSCP